MRRRFILSIMALLMCIAPVFAQVANAKGNKEKAAKETIEFNRHWYMKVQGGIAYTLGETSFKDLISPALDLSAGYQITPVWGIQFGLSGWESRGFLVVPKELYKFKYLQGNIGATLDFANLFGSFNPKRIANPYMFLGVGLNGAFDNDEANDLAYLYSNSLKNIWDGSKFFVAGRMGLGIDFRLTDYVLLGLEVNANILSDKYNSKRAHNVDWQFNALAGLKVRFGKNYTKTKKVVEPEPYIPPMEEEPVKEELVKEEPVKEEPVKEIVEEAPVVEETAVEETAVEEIRKDIFFLIGSAKVNESEQLKVNDLIDFLNANPTAKVEIIGYCDAATGTHDFNMKLSHERAESVKKALVKAGIDASRITISGKGDTVQPFEGVEKNRVSICITK